MNIGTLMILAALAASLLLFVRISARLFPAIALIASGCEAILAFKIVRFSPSGINVLLVLAVALVVAGGFSWVNTQSKPTVTAATVVTLVGAIQLFGLLNLG